MTANPAHAFETNRLPSMIAPNILGSHFFERLPLPGNWQLGHRHQSADRERLDDDGRGQRGEVLPGFFRQPEQAEHLGHARTAKFLIPSDLGSGEAGFVLYALLPVKHPANRMAHHRSTVAFVTAAAGALATRFPRKAERLRHKGSEPVLR